MLPEAKRTFLKRYLLAFSAATSGVRAARELIACMLTMQKTSGATGSHSRRHTPSCSRQLRWCKCPAIGVVKLRYFTGLHPFSRI